MQRIKVQRFNFCPRPRRAAQKLQTGFNARFIFKAVDINALRQFSPTIMFNQGIDLHFKRYAM